MFRIILWFVPRKIKLRLKAKITKALNETQVPHYYNIPPQTRRELTVERKILTDQR